MKLGIWSSADIPSSRQGQFAVPAFQRERPRALIDPTGIKG